MRGPDRRSAPGGADGPSVPAARHAVEARTPDDPPASPASDTATVVLRPLTAADLPRVLQIEAESFAVPWRRDTFDGLMARGDSDLIAAECGGVLCGYAAIWTILDQSELGDVAVAPEHRGRGVGRRLVQAAMEHARARGAGEIFLEGRESNKGAIRLYEEMGFEVIDRRRRYYTRPVEDALVMRAPLV